MLPIWEGAPEYQLNQLEILQNRVIKIIKTLPHLTPSNSLYTEKNLSLKNQYQFEIIMFIYKVKNSILKCNINLSTVSQVHSYTTRQQHDFYISNTIRTNRGQNNIFFRGLVKFNAIPRHIRELPIKQFKKEVKKLVFHN